MLQTVTSPAMPGEQQTMLVGDRAFAGTSGAMEELLPQYTQSIVAEVNQTVYAPPKGLGDFECLGPAKLDGQDFVAYRTADKSPPEADHTKIMARTIYVDPTSGLPAFNVVASRADGAEPRFEGQVFLPDRCRHRCAHKRSRAKAPLNPAR